VASRGVADLETRRPMTPGLQAPIGSITKTYTVLIALQLVGQGRLGLNDTIDRWYPWIDDASLITVKMLMNHSSGIADIGQQQVDLHCADPEHFVNPSHRRHRTGRELRPRCCRSARPADQQSHLARPCRE
jgi:D-alanyl-D-alanine carboxypeptidase